MIPGTNLRALSVNIEDQDSRKDVVCIVQDETSFDTGRSKFYANLPRSTTILGLYKRAGQEFGYEDDSFLLIWKSCKSLQNVEEMELRGDIENMTLDDVCKPPDKKKQRFFLRQKYGNNPIYVKEGMQEEGTCGNDALIDGGICNLFESSTPASTTHVKPIPGNTGRQGSRNDVVCIVQDETSFDTGRSKFYANLPRSTTILGLYKRAGKEFGYEDESFLLVWKNRKLGGNVEEMELRDGIENMTLDDVCKPPDKKKQRFFLRQKDGTYPIHVKKACSEQLKWLHLSTG